MNPDLKEEYKIKPWNYIQQTILTALFIIYSFH